MSGLFPFLQDWKVNESRIHDLQALNGRIDLLILTHATFICQASHDYVDFFDQGLEGVNCIGELEKHGEGCPLQPHTIVAAEVGKDAQWLLRPQILVQDLYTRLDLLRGLRAINDLKE